MNVAHDHSGRISIRILFNYEYMNARLALQLMLLFYIMGSVIETTQSITGRHYGRGAERCVCA